MRGDLQVSKLAANSSEVAWAQAYSTHNFYCVISVIKKNTEHSDQSLASIGKDLLEKLQREFFAIDEKNLESIKEAVINSLKEIDEDVSINLALATTKHDLLYIITYSEAQGFIARGEKFGQIAVGEDEKILAFSGRLLPHDMIILQTSGFSRACTPDTVYSIINSTEFEMVIEDLSPLIHKESKGDEAALFMLYVPTEPLIIQREEENDTRKEPEASQEESEPQIHVAHSDKLKNGMSFPKITSLTFLIRRMHVQKLIRSKKILPIIVLFLVALFIASLVIENGRRSESRREEKIIEITSPILRGIDEVKTLASLNKTLAIEELGKTESLLNENLGKFEKGSREHDRLLELKNEIESLKTLLEEGNPITDQEKIITLSSTGGGFITTSDVISFVSNDGKISLYDLGGKEKNTYSFEKTSQIIDVTSDEKFIYILTPTSIGSLDKGNGKEKIIVENLQNSKGIEIFGSNIYLLKNTGEIDRFRAPQYSSGAYFTKETGLPVKPTDFAIDGSIYVLQENGSLQKYTKGEKDPFELKGLASSFGANSDVVTSSDFKNIYVLDKNNARIVAFEKNGNFLTQYEWLELKNASDFSVTSDESRGILLIGNDIYTFSL